MGACTRKRGNVCMLESGTCMASTSSSLTLGSAVCVFGGGGVLSGGVWLPSLGFAGVPLMDGCPFPLEVCLKQRGQRGFDSLEPFDKLLVKSTQSNELSNFMNGSWRRPTSNDLDLFGPHGDSIFVDDASTEGYSTLEERGFINAGKELVLTE